MKRSVLEAVSQAEHAALILKRRCKVDDDNRATIVAKYNRAWFTQIDPAETSVKQITGGIPHIVLEHNDRVLWDYNTLTGSSELLWYNANKRCVDRKNWNDFYTLPEFQSYPTLPNPAAETCTQEALISIFNCLNGPDVLNCRLVNKWWHRWATCDNAWRHKVTLTYVGMPNLMNHYLFQNAMVDQLPHLLINCKDTDMCRAFFIHWGRVWLQQYGTLLNEPDFEEIDIYRADNVKKLKAFRAESLLYKGRAHRHKSVHCMAGCFYRCHLGKPHGAIIWVTNHYALRIASPTSKGGTMLDAMAWIKQRRL